MMLILHLNPPHCHIHLLLLCLNHLSHSHSGQYNLMVKPAGSGTFTVMALDQEASVKGSL